MQIASSSLYDTTSTYTIKLNDKELLVVDKDPLQVELQKTHETKKEKELQEKKAQEEKKADPTELSEDEQRLVNDLQSRDTEVKMHESAHQMTGGGMTGAASYTYQQGPDGKMYAIGGEVSISMQGGSTPEETIAKAKQVAAAAMAPGSPSGQDFSVATSARMMEMKAQQQLTKEKQQESQGLQTYSQDNNNLENKDQQTPSLDISA